jgi:hypothetical protein
LEILQSGALLKQEHQIETLLRPISDLARQSARR